jgi:hypothetical protein
VTFDIEYSNFEEEYYSYFVKVTTGNNMALVLAMDGDDNDARELAHRIGDAMVRFEQEKKNRSS